MGNGLYLELRSRGCRRVDLVRNRRRKKVGVVSYTKTHRGTGTRDEREEKKLGFGIWGEEKMGRKRSRITEFEG